MKDPVVKSFCNERIRPMCDRVAGLFGPGQQLLADYAAKGIDELLGKDDAASIEDGAPEDGRSPLTVGDVRAFIRQLEALDAMFQADNKAVYAIFGKAAVNAR